jgi:Xaa-Pro aminopeptidase
MTDFVFYGDTERSAAMRHEVPVSIGDPFLLAIVGGRMHVTVSGLECARVAAAVPNAVLHDFVDLGFHELLESGASHHEIDLELASRGAAAMVSVRRLPTRTCRSPSPIGCDRTASQSVPIRRRSRQDAG